MPTTISDFNPEAVIVDAGNFPTNPVPLGLIDSCPHTVCCDGAADRFIASGREPWRIVGDCDSISTPLREKYSAIIRRFPDQETNDQTKSVRYLAGKGMRRIAIVGATGMREDHTLGNISLLIEYMKAGLSVRIYTDYGVFIPIDRDTEFYAAVGSQVSIFNFGAVGLSADGLRYPIRDFSNWWEGTLNETTSSRFRIRTSGPLLIFLNYK